MSEDRFSKYPWGIYGWNEARARLSIMTLWDGRDRDTVDIAIVTSIPEHRVASVVSAYVTSKSARRSQPQD